MSMNGVLAYKLPFSNLIIGQARFKLSKNLQPLRSQNLPRCIHLIEIPHKSAGQRGLRKQSSLATISRHIKSPGQLKVSTIGDRPHIGAELFFLTKKLPPITRRQLPTIPLTDQGWGQINTLFGNPAIHCRTRGFAQAGFPTLALVGEWFLMFK